MKKNVLLKYPIYLGLVSLLIISLVLSGCGNSTPTSTSEKSPVATSKGPQSGGVLKLGSNMDAKTLGYPPEQTAYEDSFMSRPVLEALGMPEASGKMIPLLAESWKTDANAKTITILLKKGVKFHDGTDFNAEAAKWNIEQFISAKRTELNGLQSIDIIDEFTIKLNLAAWNSSMMDSVCTFVPMISPTAFKKNGKDWAVRNPIGTGPFQFVSWDRDVTVKFKKFDGYWQKGKPYLDGIQFDIIKDPLTAVASFKSHELNVYINLPTMIAKELGSAGATILKNKTGLGGRSIGLIGNSGDPKSPFADVRVRQALGYAIDSKTIVETLLYGYGELTNQWGVPSSWSYNPNLKGFPYNPEKAKQLLTEAGYPNGFKTTLLNDGAAEELQVFTAVQGYLAKVGIEAKLDTADRGRYTKLTGSTWDGLSTFHGRSDPDLALYMPRNFGAKGVLYAKGLLHTDKIEKLLVDVGVAPDAEAKTKVAKELQQVIFDEYAMYIPMYVTTWPAAKYAEVHDDGINTANANNWTPATAWIGK